MERHAHEEDSGQDSSSYPSSSSNYLEAFNALPNFHASDDIVSSSSSSESEDGPASQNRADNTAAEEAVPFYLSQSLTASKAKRKPQHAYGRKSSTKRKVVPTVVRAYLAFKELLEESAEQRYAETQAAGSEHDDRSSRIPNRSTRYLHESDSTEASVLVRRKRPRVASSATTGPARLPAPPPPNQQAVRSASTAKQKGKYQFKRPYPIQKRIIEASEGSTSLPISHLQTEATEIIEDFSDTSMHADPTYANGEDVIERTGVEEDEIVDMSIVAVSGPTEGTSPPNQPENILGNFYEQVLDNADRSDISLPTMQPLNYSRTGPLRSTNLPHAPDTTITPGGIFNDDTSSAAVFKLPAAPPAAQPRDLRGEVSAPEITFTTPTSPPDSANNQGVTRSKDVNRREISNRAEQENNLVPMATFFSIALHPETRRPPAFADLPIKRLSRAVKESFIRHTFVQEFELHEGGLFGDGYLGSSRRGWWALSLERVRQAEAGERPSGGHILGRTEGEGVPDLPAGTIIWTIQRLRVLFKQIHSMVSARRLGYLDIYTSLDTQQESKHHVRIACRSNLALTLRTLLGEVACELDNEGHETEEQANSSTPLERVGSRFLSNTESGVKLVWFDEMERKAILLA